MSQTSLSTSIDLSLVRIVQNLSRTGVRSQLNVERIKMWVKQFQGAEEKTLAWLILRNLVFRNHNQLMSSMRQAVKHATIHFIEELQLPERVYWHDALKGRAGLNFYCGPPSLPKNGLTLPGKSGELIARSVHQRYGISKYYPSDVTCLKENERFIVVDDGTYTGSQLEKFLQNWETDLSRGRVAIAVAIAHETAYAVLKTAFPNVPLFYGELLTSDMCFQALSEKWVESEQWSHKKSPLEIYDEVHKRHGPFDGGTEGNGYGGIGALVAYEHGVPDDSVQLLWGSSKSWKPLVDR